MANYLIRKLKERLGRGEVKIVLKKLMATFSESSVSNELLMLNSRFVRVESDNRMGVLSYDEYLRNSAKISQALLSFVGEVEGNSDLMALLRGKEKEVFYGSYIKLTVDYSVFLPQQTTAYRVSQFLGIDDFLNELYFEINEHVSPGSFRKEWTLKEKDAFSGNWSEIGDDEISDILNRTYPNMERTYTLEEEKSLHDLDDVYLKIELI
ncbi:MAG: hypothetical protein AAF544_06835 [Bacteroidota bacterium]